MAKWMVLAQNSANGVKIKEEVEAESSQEALDVFHSTRRGLSIEIELVEPLEVFRETLRNTPQPVIETRACPRCNAEISKNFAQCPNCDFVLEAFAPESKGDYFGGMVANFFLCGLGSLVLSFVGNEELAGFGSHVLGIGISALMALAARNQQNAKDWKKGVMVGYLVYALVFTVYLLS